MYWLIITVVPLTAINPNGTVTHSPPQPQYIQMSSAATCAAAQAAVSARSAGNFHVFADCVAQ
jgi:hypothetical protein